MNKIKSMTKRKQIENNEVFTSVCGLRHTLFYFILFFSLGDFPITYQLELLSSLSLVTENTRIWFHKQQETS